MKFRRIVIAAAAAMCCLLMTGSAQAEQTIYLEIPQVPGEVTNAFYLNQIQVNAVSWGGSKSCPSGVGSYQDVSLSKPVDKSSTVLLAALKNGTVYPTATIRFVGPFDRVYTSYQLTNAAVSSVSTGGSVAEWRNSENITLVFSQMTVTYTFIDSIGKPGASSSTTVVSNSCP